MITVLFLYRPVAWCFLRGMKFLSILMVGVALLVGGCGEKEVADEKPAKEEIQYKTPVREVSRGELEKRDELQYVKGENIPFTGMDISYYESGLRSSETPYVDGKNHGRGIYYNEDGSKRLEIVYENGKYISEKEY